MQRFLRMLPLAMAFLLSFGRVAETQEGLTVEFTPSIVRQGSVCLVIVSGPKPLLRAQAEFQGARFPIALASGNGALQGLLGIDMAISPGPQEVRVTAIDTERQVMTRVLALRVDEVSFGVQRLTLPSSLVDLDAKTLERVRKEAARMNGLLKSYRNDRLWEGPFIRPVEGEISTPFGIRRIINGQPRSSHKGVDLRAPEGTPVLASNSGIVALVDELFFSGKSVVLDHGWGMFSWYFHLSKPLVAEGDRVDRGEVLGLTGSTGRATGPHLDWGVRVNGARVDPLSLINLNQYLGE